MFHVIVIAQIITVLFGLYCLESLFHFRAGKDSKYLLMVSASCCVYSAGYLAECLSTSAEMAYQAMMFQYVGLPFVTLLFSMFVIQYCHAKTFPRIMWRLFFLFDVAMCFLAATSLHHDYLYGEYSLNTDTIIPKLIIERKPVFWVFIGEEAFLLIASLIVIVRRHRTVRKPDEKKRLTIMFIAAFLPVLGTLLQFTDLISGWNPYPFIFQWMCNVAAIGLTKGKMVDVVDAAYASLFHNVGSAIIIADMEGHYLESNSVADAVFPELQEWNAGVMLEQLGDDLLSDFHEHTFKRNGKFYSSIARALLENGKVIGYTITINDVTDIQERMEEMRLLKEDADSANQAKSVFLANMSHEIRTPLNAIIGMAELSEKEEAMQVIRDYVSQIKSAGKMLLDIVSEVLDFSKAESGKIELVPVEYDLHELLTGVINVTNMRIGDKPIDFLLDINPKIPRMLYGDDVRIRQILVNFLGNAEKFTQSGYVKLSMDYQKEGHGIRLFVSVADTGSGILPEDLKKLFTPFTQVDLAHNRKTAGTGLGLAISGQLISEMGGQHSVESVYGAGSTFSFNIPQDVVSFAPLAEDVIRKEEKVEKFASYHLFGEGLEQEAVAQEAPKELTWEEAKILVVDDNKVNVKVLCAFLKHFKIVPDCAYSGKEAIAKTEEKQYDLIFMDHMMPEMDGIDTTEEIRKSEKDYNREVPIIACTANVVKGVEELFLQAGMNDYIPKPVQLEPLREKLLAFLPPPKAL